MQNYIPYFLPGFFARKLTKFEEYYSSIKLVSGIFIFPSYYILATISTYFLFNNIWISIIYFITSPILGAHCLVWADRYFKSQNLISLFSNIKKEIRKVAKLKIKRKEIIQKIRKITTLFNHPK